MAFLVGLATYVGLRLVAYLGVQGIPFPLLLAIEVNDLTRQDTTGPGEALSKASEPYGVQIMTIHIIYAQPPVGFVRSQEAQQLAVVQQAEQAEQQALAL